MLNVVITFDYELFFGKNNGTNDEILFSPCEHLLDLLDKYQIKATFFADVLSVYMHNKYNLKQYSESFTQQIKNMIDRGHDVQLHIHSHWLHSQHRDEQWEFDIDSYRIHSFGFNKTSEFSASSIIEWGKQYLENTLTEVNSNYRCVAYRAGGYCIQPHNELFKALLDNGIRIDSSVVFDQKANGINLYDFTNLPERYGWLIGAEAPMNEVACSSNNAVFEVPIASIKNSLMRRLFCKEIEKQLARSNIRGTYIGTGKTEIPNKVSVTRKLLNYNKQFRFLTVDSVHYKLLMSKLKKITYKVNDNPSFVSIIGHPKLIDHIWLDNFEKLLIEFQKDEKICLLTMKDVAEKLSL